MIHAFITFFSCAYRAGVSTVDQDGVEHAGYLAFLGLLSFFQFMVFFVALVGVLGQAEIVSSFVDNVIGRFSPEYVRDFITPRIIEITSGPPQGLLTVAIIGVIWTASSAVEGLRTVLNRAYRVTTPPAYLYRRLMSIVQFILMTFIAIIAMFILIIGPQIWGRFTEWLMLDPLVVRYYTNWLQYGIAAGMLLLSLAASYYILPNIRQNFVRVLPGAFMVLLGWMFAAKGFAVYLSSFDQMNLVYGSLGGIIATLLFFYLISLVYIWGAQFNYEVEKAMGHVIRTKEAA